MLGWQEVTIVVMRGYCDDIVQPSWLTFQLYSDNETSTGLHLSASKRNPGIRAHRRELLLMLTIDACNDYFVLWCLFVTKLRR